MKIGSIIAIYALFWSMSFFFVLPFRLRGGPEHDPYIPGQAESAPPRFSFARTAKWTTIVSAVLFGLFYANYLRGWVSPEIVDFFSAHR